MTYEHVLTYRKEASMKKGYFGFSKGTKFSGLTEDVTGIDHFFVLEYEKDYEQVESSDNAIHVLPYEFIS